MVTSSNYIFPPEFNIGKLPVWVWFLYTSQVHNKVISGFRALHKAWTTVAWLDLAKDLRADSPSTVPQTLRKATTKKIKDLDALLKSTLRRDSQRTEVEALTVAKQAIMCIV
ncbi:hypothetical protein PoB_001645300 [Plakobranchus ocellatus]|uniref:Uncharacterized protein n=1 Tax=Plakobranchus ocellatus TaxID=259542 RepID=A0AAV3Z657_9GAST|nr:hypothetical protein PoB_001645300 [Plakobranchus ocellatus]